MSKKSHCRLKIFNEDHRRMCPLDIQNGIFCCAFCFDAANCRHTCKKPHTEMRGDGVKSLVADYWRRGRCKYQLTEAESKFKWQEYLFRVAGIKTNHKI